MNILTVTQLNTYIKACFEENSVFRVLYINGELSNFKQAYSGHCYFTLKDESAQLKCVMFSSSSGRLRFAPQDGMMVICRGRVSCYERDGVYQLYVEEMQPDGLGALNLAFEQLKNKLADEGLFADERKRPLPKYPAKIGVVTSPTGAAVQDIIKILARRFPLAQVVLYPAQVQGDGSAEDIVNGIEALNARGDIDVMIVGRGGGSLEELWSFNTEIVARAVAASTIPVISAVGHETDYTICDFVSDLRAPTPSAAAELAVPDRYQEMLRMASVQEKLKALLQSRLDSERFRLDRILSASVFADRLSYINLQKERVQERSDRIRRYIVLHLEQKKKDLFFSMESLNALNPLSVLSRGYAVVLQNEIIIKSVQQVALSQPLQVKLADGSIACKALNTIEGEK